MKTTKIFLSLMLALFGLATSLQAQRAGGRPMGSPEEMATQATQRLDSLVNLDEAQYEAVYGLNLDHMKRMQQLRQENMGDREAMKAGLLALRQEHDEALQVILTAEQYKTREAQMQSRRDSRQGRANRPGRRSGGRN